MVEDLGADLVSQFDGSNPIAARWHDRFADDYADRSFSRKPGAFPASDEICATAVSLPIGVHLTEKDVRHVCECVAKACAT